MGFVYCKRELEQQCRMDISAYQMESFLECSMFIVNGVFIMHMNCDAIAYVFEMDAHRRTY